jgi:hypothetical protein
VLRFADRSAAWRQTALVLALLALAVNVLVPSGFMPGRAARGAGVELVLCTGHGPVKVDGAAVAGGDDRGKAPAGKSSHEPLCAFAGHGAGVTAPDLAAFEPVEFVAYQAVAPARRQGDVAPGRGLAAPPLPARGPPSLTL